jgi:hypothetical protein
MENYEQSITAVRVVIYWVLYCNMRIETAIYFRLITELFPLELVFGGGKFSLSHWNNK